MSDIRPASRIAHDLGWLAGQNRAHPHSFITTPEGRHMSEVMDEAAKALLADTPAPEQGGEDAIRDQERRLYNAEVNRDDWRERAEAAEARIAAVKTDLIAIRDYELGSYASARATAALDTLTGTGEPAPAPSSAVGEALEECASSFVLYTSGSGFISFDALASEFNRRQKIAAKALASLSTGTKEKTDVR